MPRRSSRSCPRARRSSSSRTTTAASSRAT
jgi:hypothetical protein